MLKGLGKLSPKKFPRCLNLNPTEDPFSPLFKAKIFFKNIENLDFFPWPKHKNFFWGVCNFFFFKFSRKPEKKNYPVKKKKIVL